MANSAIETAPFPIRGVIEGFYGPPWTHAARLRMIDFMGAAGFNTYIYAPKDDPYHRERWRDAYPAAAFQKLKQLIQKCRDQNVDFCWAVSPGLSIEYGSSRAMRAFVKKLLTVAGQGVSVFNLLLDDIPHEMKHGRDRKRYKTFAHAHADFAGRLLAALQKSNPDCRLWYCPTDYTGTAATPYLETIGKELHPDVGVFWTGPAVVSAEITVADARAFGEIIGRKPLLWDNYPVNDYNRNVLNLGPLRNRDPQLGSALAGCFTNPMNEAECSKIAMWTISDYLHNPGGYDADKSWRAALHRVGGGGPGAAALKLFAEYCSNRVFPDEPKSCIPQRVEKARDGKYAELMSAVSKVELIQEKLRDNTENPYLLREIRPYALKLERTAAAVRLAIDAKKAAPGERDAIIKRLIPLLRGIKYDPKNVANGVLQNFALNLAAEIQPGLRI